MADITAVRVHCAASGKRYVQLGQGPNSIVMPFGSFVGRKAPEQLARVGILIENRSERQALTDRISAAEPNAHTLVAEDPGWIGSCFILMDGELLHEPIDREVVVAFNAEHTHRGQAGTYKAWRDEVAGGLAGQSVPMMAIMACLLPPLRPYMPFLEAFALEIVDPSYTATVLTQLAASVAGGIGLGANRSSAVSLAGLMEDPLGVVKQHRDHALVLDGADAYFDIATPKERSKLYNTLAHQLPLWGRGGHGYDGQIVAILAGSNSLRTSRLPGGGDGLVTINLSVDRQYGAFDHLPSSYASASAFSNHLRSKIWVEHGTAFRHWVQLLPEPSSDKGAKLGARLAGWQEEFLSAAEERLGQVRGHRSAGAFAACYATGMYARARAVLPKAWDCLEAILQCFDLHLNAVKPLTPLAQQLEQLVEAGSILEISHGSDPAARIARAQELEASLWETPAGREIRMTAKAATKLLTGWPAILGECESRDILLAGDGNHRQKKAPLAPGLQRGRLFCFLLPPTKQNAGIFPEDSETQALAKPMPRRRSTKPVEYIEIVD